MPHVSRDHVIVSNTVKITFILDTESTYKTHSIVNNVGKALVIKKVLMRRSKKIYEINKTDILGTYIDVYLSEKEPVEKFQDIQSANCLKAEISEKRQMIQQ